MNTSLKALVAAIGVSVMSSTAFAATTISIEPDLFVDQNIEVGGEEIGAGDALEFRFTAGERLKVLDFFAFTANGSNGGADVGLAIFRYDGDGGMLSTGPTQVVPLGSQGIAFASLPGFVLQEGEGFSLFLENGVAAPGNTVDLDASFSTAAIPVPAAGLLLLTALVGGGAMARRKKSA